MRAVPLRPRSIRLCLFLFFALSWLHMLWMTRTYVAIGLDAAGADIDTLFHAAAWPFYSLLYLVPAASLTWLVSRFAGGRRVAAPAFALLTTTLTLLLVRADGLIYELYAFHINGFVLNLIFTPGGIESLGSGQESLQSFALIAASLIAVQTLFLAASLRLPCVELRRKRHLLPLGLVFLTLFCVQGTVYGISDLSNYGPVLEGSMAFPFFHRVRFRSLAGRFGFEHKHRSEFAAMSATTLRYPRAEVPFAPPAAKPNIIVLVAESLRWDQLDPETMPNTWAFGQRARRFAAHYSSGNGTREGLFGMFYGLYGSYWQSFMAARQPPLLMQRLEELGYAFDVRTSATFSYPEFDQTLFASLPSAVLHTADGTLPPWERDARNTDELLAFLDSRPAGQPFFEFFFLESTHAPYSFSPEQALHADYQREVNYAELDLGTLAANREPLLKRYQNAAHWIDAQLGRIYEALEQRGMLDDTIVIVTGDHGEEFMEKGAWGHNSAFVEEQTHVPLLLAMPGIEPGVSVQPSSHLDIATTLLDLLGAGGDPANYTLGVSLLQPVPREHLVVSDWHSIGILRPDFKYRIPYLNLSGADYWAPTDGDDRLLGEAQAEASITRYRELILQTMANCTAFSGRNVADQGASE